MAEEPKHERDEDEYHFTDIEGTEYETPSENAEMESLPRSKSNMRRNVIIAIGLFVVVLAVYKLIGSYVGPTQSTANIPQALGPQKPTAAVTPVTPPPIQQPPISQQPLQPQTEAQTSAQQDLAQKISSLEVTTDSTKSQVNDVNNNVTELKSNLNDLTNKINELNATVENLANIVTQQQQQLATLKPKPRPKPMIIRVNLAETRFFIQAIIPGRAWLKSPNGATITVGKGSKINGYYGRVRYIDPERGIVATTSGKVIRFSPNDL